MPFRVTYNGGESETQGLVGGTGGNYFFSPFALTTRGFVYGVGDIWFNLDSSIVQNVTWTAETPPSTSWSDESLPSTTWTACTCSPFCE